MITNYFSNLVNEHNKDTMKKLLNTYGFTSDMQYFEMIQESFINGQYTQAIEQFKAMPKGHKIAMLKAITGNWENGITDRQRDLLFDAL